MTKCRFAKEREDVTAKADDYQYPGDEVIYKAIGGTLRELRLQAGMSIEQAEKAFREVAANTDYRAMYRAFGMAVKEERERQSMSRCELSRMTGLPRRDLILLERGQLSRLPAAYLFRISYALKISPAVLARRFEAVQESIIGSRRKA
jgi:cytoskeletal protein RodZ